MYALTYLPGPVDDWADNLGDAGLVITTSLVVLFAVLYGVRSQWRVLVVGRTLMYLLLSFAAVLVQGTATVVLGFDYPYRSEVRLLVYALAITALARMLVTLIRVQSRRRQLRRPDAFPMNEVRSADEYRE